MFAVSAPAAPSLATPQAPSAPGQNPVVLQLIPAHGLCEASVLRLLARSGVRVQRRSWGPACTPGGAPTLRLCLHPAPHTVLQHATRLLHERTGAQVGYLPASSMDWASIA